MGDFVELMTYIWTELGTFLLGLAAVWSLMGLVALVGRWLERRDLQRWTGSDGNAGDGEAIPRYTRALLGGRLRPEEVEGVSSGEIRAGAVAIAWSRDGISLAVDGERYSLEGERFSRIQLSKATEPAVPHWWWGQEPPAEWLAVTVRFGEHDVKLRAAMPSDWDDLVLPELRSTGEVVALDDLLSLLEAAVFHEVTIAEHRLSPSQTEPATSEKENLTARYASWLYLFAPIAILYPFWMVASVIHEEFTHYTETLLDMPELLFVLVPLIGGVVMGMAAFRYTRRLVRAGVWPDAAGPRKRKYNHHFWYSVALTLLWMPVAAIPAAIGSLYGDVFVLPLLGLTVGIGAWVSHRILKSRRYVHGPSEPHMKGPHVELEYGQRPEAGR